MKNKTHFVIISFLMVTVYAYAETFSDDFATIALYRMNAIVDQKIIDEDVVSPRENHLLLGDPNTSRIPDLVVEDGRSALYYNGIDSMSQSSRPWFRARTFKLNASFKLDIGGAAQTRYLFMLSGAIKLKFENNLIVLDVYGGKSGLWDTWSLPITENVWETVQVVITQEGQVNFSTSTHSVNGQITHCETYSPYSRPSCWAGEAINRIPFWIGCPSDGGNSITTFKGWIDEIKIGVDVPQGYIPESMPAEDYSTFSTLRSDTMSGTTKKIIVNCNPEYAVERDVIPDGFEPRNNVLILGNPLNQNIFPTTHPVLVGDPNESSAALSYNGGQIAAWQPWPGVGTLKFSVWVYPTIDTLTKGTGGMLFFIQGRVRLQWQYGSLRLFVRKYDNSGYGPAAIVCTQVNQWDYITVEINEDGSYALQSIFGGRDEQTTGQGWLNSRHTYFYLGHNIDNFTGFVNDWGYKGLIKDVCVSMPAAVDNPDYYEDTETLSLLKMDDLSQREIESVNRNIVNDDAILMPARDNYLILGSHQTDDPNHEPILCYAHNPAVYSSDLNCLKYDGQDDMAWWSYWPGYRSLKFDAWVLPQNIAAPLPALGIDRHPILFILGGKIRLWYKSENLRVAVRNGDADAWSGEMILPIVPCVWDRVSLEVRPDGTFTLSSLRGGAVDGSTGTGDWFYTSRSYIGIGNDLFNYQANSDWAFDGLIGQVRLSIPRYPLANDLTGDGRIDFNDMVVLAHSWMTAGRAWYEGDLTGNYEVDINDLSALAGSWLDQ